MVSYEMKKDRVIFFVRKIAFLGSTHLAKRDFYNKKNDKGWVTRRSNGKQIHMWLGMRQK